MWVLQLTDGRQQISAAISNTYVRMRASMGNELERRRNERS